MVPRLLFTMLAITLLYTHGAQADPSIEWNDMLVKTFADPSVGWDPEYAAYAAARMNIAIYDAVNAIDQKHAPYVYPVTFKATDKTASQEAAAAQAAHDALIALTPTRSELWPSYDQLLATQLKAIGDGPARDRGRALGQASAQAIALARAGDGSGHRADIGYIAGIFPGNYRLTGMPADKPAWGKVKLFALESTRQFLPSGPLPLRSEEYARELSEVKSLGRKDSTMRTPEQTCLAFFWAEQEPGQRTPPGSWIVIAMTLAQQQKNTLTENARMFALLSMAMADAGTVSWDVKYTYIRWRPITAIRMADDDGNDKTTADPQWDSLLPAPNFPSYFSGHSTFGFAAASTLANFFGTDTLQFVATSTSVPEGITGCTPRPYSSLMQAARDNGRARIYLGVHMEHENVDADRVGRQIGEFVSARYLYSLSKAL